MFKRFIVRLTFCISVFVGLTAHAELISVEFSIPYDEPEPGIYRWNIVRIVRDTAPIPGTPGHDDDFPVHNSEGRNVAFMKHVHFAVTETQIDPRSNDYADILYTHYDFDEIQVASMNYSLDQAWLYSGCYPIPIRIADASIVYNRFAYALGYTDRMINDIKYFTTVSYFTSGVPDWRLLQSQEKPDRAAHGHHGEEHGSIVTQETRSLSLGGYTFSSTINLYTGKYGEFGVYKSDGSQAPENYTTAGTEDRKRKSS